MSCSLYEFRKNGITTLADGNLYDKLKFKRLNSKGCGNGKAMNWKKLLPKNLTDLSAIEQLPKSPPVRKKASPLEIIGEIHKSYQT